MLQSKKSRLGITGAAFFKSEPTFGLVELRSFDPAKKVFMLYIIYRAHRNL